MLLTLQLPLFMIVFLIPVWLTAAWAADDAWKSKRVAEWTEQETKQILNDSPWAVMTSPSVKKEEKRPHGGGMGIGMPGMGRRRSNEPVEDPNAASPPDMQLELHLRWESALPIREAELKARETNAPVVEEDRYAIAVYGIPSHFTKEPQNAGDRLKGQAAIKRTGQKDIKPLHVDVIERDEGLVIVYLFPRTKEITAKDASVEFNALIGPYQVAQSFHVDQMIYLGKPEL
jgi:hypothetical protein